MSCNVLYSLYSMTINCNSELEHKFVVLCCFCETSYRTDHGELEVISRCLLFLEIQYQTYIENDFEFSKYCENKICPRNARSKFT